MVCWLTKNLPAANYWTGVALATLPPTSLKVMQAINLIKGELGVKCTGDTRFQPMVWKHVRSQILLDNGNSVAFRLDQRRRK